MHRSNPAAKPAAFWLFWGGEMEGVAEATCRNLSMQLGDDYPVDFAKG